MSLPRICRENAVYNFSFFCGRLLFRNQRNNYLSLAAHHITTGEVAQVFGTVWNIAEYYVGCRGGAAHPFPVFWRR